MPKFSIKFRKIVSGASIFSFCHYFANYPDIFAINQIWSIKDTMSFIHLHVNSSHSPLDGYTSIEAYFRKAES